LAPEGMIIRVLLCGFMRYIIKINLISYGFSSEMIPRRVSKGIKKDPVLNGSL